MPSRYLYKCPHCGTTQPRYCNAHACRGCGNHGIRRVEPIPDEQPRLPDGLIEDIAATCKDCQATNGPAGKACEKCPLGSYRRQKEQP